jgi:hypothetical protein
MLGLLDAHWAHRIELSEAEESLEFQIVPRIRAWVRFPHSPDRRLVAEERPQLLHDPYNFGCIEAARIEKLLARRAHVLAGHKPIIHIAECGSTEFPQPASLSPRAQRSAGRAIPSESLDIRIERAFRALVSAAGRMRRRLRRTRSQGQIGSLVTTDFDVAAVVVGHS